MASRRNNVEKLFPVATAAGHDTMYWGLWSARDGGNFLHGGPVQGDPDALDIGDRYRIPVNGITITVNASVAQRLSEAGAGELLEGLTAGTKYLSLHSADPGNTGANEFAGAAYARQQIDGAQWTGS